MGGRASIARPSVATRGGAWTGREDPSTIYTRLTTGRREALASIYTKMVDNHDNITDNNNIDINNTTTEYNIYNPRTSTTLSTIMTNNINNIDNIIIDTDNLNNIKRTYNLNRLLLEGRRGP